MNLEASMIVEMMMLVMRTWHKNILFKMADFIIQFIAPVKVIIMTTNCKICIIIFFTKIYRV